MLADATVFDHPELSGHEQVVFANDEAAGLRAIIAVHSTARGPALGGCRIWPYPSEAAALTDVLRLSRGMTYKGAAADLPFGGGKMVVIADPRTSKSERLLRAIGAAIEQLRGGYVTGEDVGTTADDMEQIGRETANVLGLPADKGGSGDPSPSTALGCFVGLRACVERVFGSVSLEGRTVAVQGLGNVGWRLCELLHRASARLVVADVQPERAGRAAERLGAAVVDPGAIHAVPADVLAPCALGGILSDETLPDLQARIVAGAANNQLARPEHADRLRRRGILYAPDYVINAGGMIQLASERIRFASGELDRRIQGIGDTLRQVFDLADADDVSTHQAADCLAEARVAAARAAETRGAALPPNRREVTR